MSRWQRFRRLFGPDPAGDVDDELSFHVEMRVRELVERGESPERARELALRRFGEYEGPRSECVEIDQRRRRRMSRKQLLSTLAQDIGYALRLLRRTPGFTIVAVATLALGIGANTAIFSVVHGVLLKSLPFRDADRLYEVNTVYPDGTRYSLSAPDFMSVREETRAFEQVEAYTDGVSVLTGVGEPREVRSARISDGLFEMLGLPMVLGRGFRPEEHEPGMNDVVVLDHGFWQRELGGDAAVLGRTLVLAGDPYRVVGVLGPRAWLTARRPAPGALPGNDLYLPLAYDDGFSALASDGRRSEFLRVLARGRPGVGADGVESDARRVGTLLQSAFPNTNARLTFGGTPLREVTVGDVETPLLVLLGAVGFVLLVACANVANLLLARASARQGELAVRAALGAGRARLLRQLLTESVVLGLCGGALGLLIAYAGTKALIAAQPADIPRLEEVGVDGTVVIFTVATALLTSLAFGAMPALQSTGTGLMRTLREGGRGAGMGRSGHRARATLVVAEMALAVVLLMGAGLLIRSFIALTRVDPGFNTENAMAFRLSFQGDAYEGGQQIRNRVDELEHTLRAVPGVGVVGAGSSLPLSRGSMWSFGVLDAPPPPPDVNAEIAVVLITPGYFAAIGTPRVGGRAFTERDHNEAPAVALINESGVRRWFAGEDPIGRRVDANGEREIVGVVSDVLHGDPGEPASPQLYVPFAQATSRTVRFIVRTAGDPLALTGAVRAEVRALDPDLAIAEFVPLRELIAASVARPRFYTSLLALFAGIGLALAATGVFGVMSYTVAQRTREIGIRMTLGARAGDVVRMVVGRTLVLAAFGGAAGIIAAIQLGKVLQSQLFGVTLLDPITLGAVVIVLAVSALAASYLPARRAAMLDPGTTLRDD